jgi:hypothetical protein
MIDGVKKRIRFAEELLRNTTILSLGITLYG